MKYAVVIVLDQTIGLLTKSGSYTTKHPEAQLFDSKQEADQAVTDEVSTLKTTNKDGNPISQEILDRRTPWVEEVTDEAEFRAREDTW